MKTMKRFLGIMLSFALVLGLLAGKSTMPRASADGTIVISSNDNGVLLIDGVPAEDNTFDYETLYIETYLLPAGDYVLEQNLNIGRPICVNSGAVSLDIKTFNITNNNSKQGETGGSAIIITGGATFTLNGGSGVIKSTNNTSERGGGVLVHYGNFIMNGGNISGNNVPIGAGVYVYGSGNFEMNGGKISNNTGWGAIVNQGTFSMSGGEITDNAECGIQMWNSNVTLSGTAKIIGNKNASGEDCNLPLGNDKTITVGKFSTGAQIGITANSQRPFSIGYNTNNSGIAPATFFKSDDSGYAVALTDSGEAQLVSGYTVTYKVVNGTWSDGTTTDITEDVASGEKPAKVPTGMKPAEGYTGGAWDKDPTAATITEATMFTYAFTKAPAANTLAYNGQPQKLVTAGTVEGGTMMYALGTDAATAPTEGWSEAIPTGVDAKTYYVWYMVKGDANHNDTKPACVEATIAKKGLTVTADAKSKTQGEADPALTYTVDGLVAGDTITGSLSREAGEDPGTYAITQGTLTAGDNYEITFTSAVLTINKKDEPAPAPSGGGGSGGGGGYYGGGTVQNQRRDAYSDVIGAAATNFRDSSPERIRNIELACEKLDGIVLQPGEVFSFNEALGGLTAEAGFAVAPVNPDDEATAEMGGGVSQAASTLYTGSLFALLETVERGNHPYAVPFIQPGTDAYVTDPGNADALDLKFRNTRGEPIRISAKTRVDEARQVREIVIELRSALGSSDYMPIRFDNTWGGDQNAFLTETPYDLTRPGYRILLTHEEQAFTDDKGAGIRTLTHRKILDSAGMLVRDEILNSKLPDGSYAMDTYYQG